MSKSVRLKRIQNWAMDVIRNNEERSVCYGWKCQVQVYVHEACPLGKLLYPSWYFEFELGWQITLRSTSAEYCCTWQLPAQLLPVSSAELVCFEYHHQMNACSQSSKDPMPFTGSTEPSSPLVKYHYHRLHDCISMFILTQNLSNYNNMLLTVS